MEAELGADAPEDYVDGVRDVPEADEPEPPVNTKLQKMALIQDLLAQTDMKSTRTNEYKAWGIKALGKRAFPLKDMPEADLDSLISALNERRKAENSGQAELL